MIDHLTVRVRDLNKAKAFYASALAPLGYSVLMEFGEYIGLGADQNGQFKIHLSASPERLRIVVSNRLCIIMHPMINMCIIMLHPLGR